MILLPLPAKFKEPANEGLNNHEPYKPSEKERCDKYGGGIGCDLNTHFDSIVLSLINKSFIFKTVKTKKHALL